MSFINPIRRLTPPRFAESSGLRSPRDYDATQRLWQKGANVSQQNEALAQAVGKLQAEVNRLRRRHIASNFVQFHPFKIHNFPNGADTWRTFAVRGGYVGLRRRYDNVYDPSPLTGFNATPYGGNWEHVFYVNNGTDLVAPYYGDADFESGPVDAGHTKTTLTVTGSAVQTGVGQSVFVIDTEDTANFSEDGSGALMAGFWIAVTNDADDLKLEVKCKLAVFGSHSGGISGDPWPQDDPDIIPIGVVGTKQAGTDSADFPYGSFAVNQYLFEHVTNRYCRGVGVHHGDEDSDPDIDIQMFYPGDTLTTVDAFTPGIGWTSLIRCRDNATPHVPAGDYSQFELVAYVKV